MKVAILAGYFTPEKSADTHLNEDLAQAFAAYGADVTVVVPFPSRGLDEQTQQRYLALREEQRSEHLRICRVGGRTVYRAGLLARAVGLLKKTWQMYRAAKAVDADAYFIISTPPFLGYAGALLSRRAPVIYKLQDVFPDSLIHAGKMREGSIPIRFFRLLERWVYRKVSHIHVSSGDMKETLIKRGVAKERISVVYDWIDQQACVPVPREQNPLFDRLGLPAEKFYVSYAGNIGLLQNVETILAAAARLRDTMPEIGFVIIGDGAWKQEMERQIEKLRLTNVYHFPMQPVEMVSCVYSLGDVELVSLKPGVTKMALPSKTWSILSAARPVLCEIDLDSELQELIRQNGCGVCVAPGDDAALAEKVVEFYRLSAQERQMMGLRGRSFIENNLTRIHATKKHYEQVRRLCHE